MNIQDVRKKNQEWPSTYFCSVRGVGRETSKVLCRHLTTVTQARYTTLSVMYCNVICGICIFTRVCMGRERAVNCEKLRLNFFKIAYLNSSGSSFAFFVVFCGFVAFPSICESMVCSLFRTITPWKSARSSDFFEGRRGCTQAMETQLSIVLSTFPILSEKASGVQRRFLSRTAAGNRA